MDRCRLKGGLGDPLNAVLAAAEYNLRLVAAGDGQAFAPNPEIPNGAIDVRCSMFVSAAPNSLFGQPCNTVIQNQLSNRSL